MNPCEEFLRHAADCEEMAKATRLSPLYSAISQMAASINGLLSLRLK